MIERLRRRHRHIWWVLAVLIPAIFLLAMVARPAESASTVSSVVLEVAR